MRHRTILTIVLGISTVWTGCGPAIAQDRAPAADQLVLFGAHWCAPCRGEAAVLPALVRAAAPARVVIAWIDRPFSLPAGLPPDRVAVLPPAAAEALAGRVGGPGYGVPFTASIDGNGHVCQVRQKPLKPEDVAALLAACHP